jgi:hypothetical protein
MIMRNAAVVFDRRTARQADMWDLQVREQFPNLQIQQLRPIIPRWALAIRGALEGANEIICNLNKMNEMVRWMQEEENNIALREERRKHHYPIDCDWDHCNREGCPFDPTGPQWDPDNESEPVEKRAAKIINETM